MELMATRFGFACFGTMEEAHNCIRGFYLLGYEVSFARVGGSHEIWRCSVDLNFPPGVT